MRINQLTVWVALALGTMSAQSAVTDTMIEDDAKTPGDIVSWGIGQQGQRYSPLKQINAQTIGRLVPAWSFSFGGEKQRGQESQPLIHNGKMFVTGARSPRRLPRQHRPPPGRKSAVCRWLTAGRCATSAMAAP